MTTEQLQTFHRTQPFRPFTIYLADGRTFRVNHPELLAHAPNSRTFAVWSDGVYDVIDLLLVSSLRPVNGERRRGRSRG
jgi:hypothetical protein